MTGPDSWIQKRARAIGPGPAEATLEAQFITGGGCRPMPPLACFLGRFFGLSCLVMCAALFARPRESLESIESMKEIPGLVLVTGILTMVGGVAAVVGHNVWSGGALPVTVTLLGWVTLIK